MGFKEYISIIIAILGWGIGYMSSSRINLKSKKREITINYLIEAYQTISMCCARGKLSPEIEKAISDIQLFGTELQVKIAKEFAYTISDNGSADMENLLQCLRDSLRKELNLSTLKVNNKISHFRVGK